MANHDKNYESVFSQWLNGELSASDEHELEAQLADQAPELHERMQSVRWMQQQADSYQSNEVPHWNRAAVGPQPKAHRWANPWSFAAFACSCAALAVLSVFVMKQQLTAQFDARVAAVVDEKLTVFEQQQNIALAKQEKTLRANFREQLSTSTAQLATYIMATNRAERKDDMSQLVEYVNETRSEDLNFYTAQLRQVAQKPILLKEENQ
ncbi:hypothetical protein [Idiomarina sp. UBA3162]|uniref:hypothetical protein n=1 Tax=Idiomarina sp. UBA3162 TaxID=1946641 RepID=UPI000C964FAF|nr:hypothetical protein [Idiomarina sp. UBA3162]MAD54104.1 hypothetical protein [Idiomarinaceae bacterium]|tara:strand:- start:3698 stop:4324 length:627 start_codon:yes stop_codon:yes gene_type:complete